jgi:hypothetical protein
MVIETGHSAERSERMLRGAWRGYYVPHPQQRRTRSHDTPIRIFAPAARQERQRSCRDGTWLAIAEKRKFTAFRIIPCTG